MVTTVSKTIPESAVDWTVGGNSGALAPRNQFTLLGLFLLPFVISLGPRFELFSELTQAHLRIQDFIVPPVFLVASVFWMLRSRGRSDLRMARLAMMASALVVLATALAIMAATEGVEMLVRLGYLYRLAVLPMIASLVFLGLRSQGTRGLFSLGLGFGISLCLNFGWFFWQVIIGQNYEAWRFTSKDPWNWGLVTIGEGAPNPAGQYVVLVLAATLAGTLVAKRFWVSFHFAVASFGLVFVLYLTQARASITSGVVITTIVLLVTLWNALPRTTLSHLTVLVFLGSSALVVYNWLAEGRLGPAALMFEFSRRAREWDRGLTEIEGAEFFGLGPGGPSGGGGHAHSLYVFLIRDYGAVGLVIFGLVSALLVHIAREILAQTSDATYQAVALVVLFLIINLLVSGFAQDSLNPVIFSHLLAVFIGAFLWVRQEILPGTISRRPQSGGRN